MVHLCCKTAISFTSLLTKSFGVHLFMIPIKELQEAGLSPGGPLHPSEPQISSSSLKVAHVHDQILQPQTCSLAHCSQLSWPEKKKHHREGDYILTNKIVKV